MPKDITGDGQSAIGVTVSVPVDGDFGSAPMLEAVIQTLLNNDATLNDIITGATYITININDGDVTNLKLADEAVSLVKLKINNSPTDGQVLIFDSTDGMRWETPTKAAIPDGVISIAMLATNAVTEVKLADESVTEPKLNMHNQPAHGQVLTYDDTNAMQWETPPAPTLPDGSVITSQLAASAVTTDKLGASSITKAKLADESVTSSILDTHNTPTEGQGLALSLIHI